MTTHAAPAATSSPIARRRRPRWFIPLALLLGCLLALLLSEVLLRGYLALRGWTPNCYAASLDLFQPDPATGCTLKAGFRLRSSLWNMSTNSLGLRGPELIEPRPADTVRIAILGGSSAFGYLVNDGEEAARLLEKRLRSAGVQAEVINAGVPGYSLFQTRIRFQKLVAPLQPDIVICYAGWNDLGYVVSQTPDTPRHRFRPVNPAWQRLAARSVTYSLIVHRLLGATTDLPPAELPDYEVTSAGQTQFLANLNGLVDDIHGCGARVLICAQATTARHDVADQLRHYLGATRAQQEGLIELGGWLRTTLRDVAQDRGLAFLDAGEAIAPTPGNLLDNVHLSREGEQLLARVLEQTVRSLLAP